MTSPPETAEKECARSREAALYRAIAGELDYPGLLVDAIQWIDEKTVILQVTKSGDKTWLRFDCDGRRLQTLFDTIGIESAVNSASTDKGFRLQDAGSLSMADGETLGFDWNQQAWRCTHVDGALRCVPAGPATEYGRAWPAGADVSGVMGPKQNMSPDGQFAATRDGPNIRIEAVDGRRPHIVTADGALHYEYGNTLATSWSGRVQVAIAGLEAPADGIWSGDSRYFLTFVTDCRHTTELPLLRSQPPGGRRVPPDVLWFKSQLATDETLVQLIYVVFDTKLHSTKIVKMPWIDAPVDPVRNRFVLWKNAPEHGFYFLSHSRGAREIVLWEADASDPVARRIRTESSNTRAGVTTSRPQYGVQHIAGTSDYVWMSDSGGRAAIHYLRGGDGRIVHRISQDDASFADIKHIDLDQARVYYTGHPDCSLTDPARLQLYSASLDGTGHVRHTSLDYHHDVHFPPDGTAYIDVASHIEAPPTISIAWLGNGVSHHLLTSDAHDWSLPPAARPRRFRALAADGETPLFGTMFRPSYWSPQQRYPLVDWVYGSAEVAFAAEGFNEDSSDLQILAESGLIVIKLDARGTPGRTKAFNDCGIGAGHNLCGVDDHIAVMRALARDDGSIDEAAMGAGGWSGGGQCAWRFATRGNGFFKAVVIGAPSSDPYLLGPAYAEQFLGVARDSAILYQEGADDPGIGDIDAALLLIHGELDDDVHPAHTMRLARQLIDAGKLFEMLILPGCHHHARNSYVMRSISDFYARRLRVLSEHRIGNAGTVKPTWHRQTRDDNGGG